MKRTCLVASDEEDVDGNLSNSNVSSRGRPRRATKRVVYQTTDSQSEDSDNDCKTERKNVQGKLLPVRKRGRPSRNIDSKTTFQPILPKPFAVFIKEEPSACSDTGSSSNAVKTTTDPQPSCSNSERPIINHQVKKLKYDRQATPICDAIMKEYSKRQKLMRMQGKTDGPDLSDLPIKDIIAKGRMETERKNSSDLPQSKSSVAKVNNEAESEDSSKKTQLVTVKQERDSEPIVCSKDESKIKSDGLLQPVTVKQERHSEPIIYNKEENKIKSDGRLLQPVVVIKRETLHPIRKGKRPPTDVEDDTDDPTWTPESSNESRLSRLTRSATKSKQQNRLNLNNEDIVEKCDVPPPTTNSPSPPPLESRLASIADSISDFLNSEDSSAIDDEAQKLLRTTQELIKLKNNKIQQNSPMSSSLDLNIKQEPSSQSEDCSNVNSSQLVNDKEEVAQTVTLKEKFTFVMEYFTSYQEVFNTQVFEDVIPLLSDIMLLCMDDLKECLQRMKNARSVTTVELRQKEIQLASQAYINVVMSFGEKFFNTFDSVVETIVKTKTPKPIMTTWIYFVANSLFTKAPKYKGQIHKVRNVIMLISRIYKYHHPLVWDVLESPDQIYEEELKTLIEIIKYYHDRNFALVPDVNIFNHWLENFEKDQHIQTADYLLIDELVAKIKIAPSMDKNRHKYSYEKDFNPSDKSQGQSVRPLSNIAAQFFEALQDESDYNSKRIEEKLDNILEYLSDNKSQGGVHLAKKHSGRKNDNRDENLSSLSKIMQHDQAGLDSLLMPHTISSGCKIKTEPVVYDQEQQITSTTPSRHDIYNPDHSQSVRIKEEPQDFCEPPQFSSVVIPTSGTTFYSELNE